MRLVMNAVVMVVVAVLAAVVRGSIIAPEQTTYSEPGTVYVPSTAETDHADDQRTDRGNNEAVLLADDTVGNLLGAHHQLSQLPVSEVDLVKESKYNLDVAYKHAQSLSDADKKAFLHQQANEINGGTISYPDCSSCDASARFRTLTGECNNVANCLWGSNPSTFRRIMAPQYGDNNTPRNLEATGAFAAKTGAFSNVLVHSPSLTMMNMQFGQYLAHDLSATPTASLFDGNQIKEVRCCAGHDYYECLPFYSTENCHSFVRSAPGLIDRNKKYCYGEREQMNVVTAFIDGSPTYGSSAGAEAAVRDGTTPFLATWNNPSATAYPYPATSPDQYCQGSPSSSGGNDCFVAGDSRPNVHLGMMLKHTLFLREHNRIAKKIQEVRSSWNNDTVYSEARRILGALLQVITYDQYLPNVIGDDLMNAYGLKTDSRSSYSSTTDPGIFNSFATAAFRFGHSQIYEQFKMANHRTAALVNDAQLQGEFFNPNRIYNHYNIAIRRYLLGMVYQPQAEVDTNFVNAISEPLMFRAHAPEEVHKLRKGLDLAALNIQRGRDHGLPGYQDWVNYIAQFDATSISYQDGTSFDGVGGIENADLFVGGLMENHLPGAAVGKTFGHIIALQFKHLKDGDRFFFNHDNVDSSIKFSDEQVAELKKVNIAQLMCNNADMNDRSVITRDVFHIISDVNPLVSCQVIKGEAPNIETLLGL